MIITIFIDAYIINIIKAIITIDSLKTGIYRMAGEPSSACFHEPIVIPDKLYLILHILSKL
jgi:hypothetical protein